MFVMTQEYWRHAELAQGSYLKVLDSEKDIQRFLSKYEGDSPWIQGWQIKKFADKLKEIAALLIGAKREDFESEAFKNSYLPEEWDTSGFHYYNSTWHHRMTVRELLQKLGTEAIRDNIHKNAWVNALFADYVPEEKNYIGHGDYTEGEMPKWIITDVRFPNEAQAIKNRGGIILRMTTAVKGADNFPRRLVHSEEGSLVTSNWPTHLSEIALDNYSDFDKLINNSSSLSDLFEQAKYIVEKYKLA